jgi:hypothetical protein
MLQSLLAYLATLAIFLLGNALLARPHEPAPRRHGTLGPSTLRARPGRYANLACLALTPTVFVIVVVMRLGYRRDEWFGLGLAATLVTIGLATTLWCLAAEFRERFRVDDAGIEWVGVLSRRVVPWDAVARITYNPRHNWFFLTAANGTHLWLWDDLLGISDFAAIALRRLPAAALHADIETLALLQELAAGPFAGAA